LLDSALQLGVAVLVATLVFYGAYSLPQKVAATILVLLIPFQPVETRFFSANVLATYAVFIALLLRGSQIRLPMLPQILIVLFFYLLSFALVAPSTYVQHAVYIVALISAFMVFWIVYDLTVSSDSPRRVVNILLIVNIIVAIYCFIQLGMGAKTKLVFFGNQDFAFMPMRRDNRLTGPFGAAGVTAEYFVIMIYLVLHEIIATTRTAFRRGLMLLLGINMLLLITTGNRGGFLTMLGASLIFIWLFRKTLGPRRIIGIVSGGAVLLVLTASVAINYTDFGKLFDRLADTEIEEGIPDTRQDLWPSAWKEIKRKPMLGHGPRLRFDGGDEGRRYKGHQFMRYPHNLYLFLTLTVGYLGLMAFMVFLFTPLIRCWRVSRLETSDAYLQGLAKTGLVIMIILLIDQMKVSFMRLSMVDYWHFIFAILGLFIGVCDRARASIRNPAVAVSPDVLQDTGGRLSHARNQ